MLPSSEACPGPAWPGALAAAAPHAPIFGSMPRADYPVQQPTVGLPGRRGASPSVSSWRLGKQPAWSRARILGQGIAVDLQVPCPARQVVRRARPGPILGPLTEVT